MHCFYSSAASAPRQTMTKKHQRQIQIHKKTNIIAIIDYGLLLQQLTLHQLIQTIQMEYQHLKPVIVLTQILEAPEARQMGGFAEMCRM